MFQIGEMIVYGKHGVCKISNIGTLNMPMVDKNKQYYTLEPCKERAAVVYAPVENNKTVMRKVLTPEQIEDLFQQIPKLDTVWIGNDREREQCYKDALRTCDCRDLIRMIKTLYIRQKVRLESGKKITAVDERYYRMAEEQLYGELSFVMGKTKAEIEASIIWE